MGLRRARRSALTATVALAVAACGPSQFGDPPVAGDPPIIGAADAGSGLGEDVPDCDDVGGAGCSECGDGVVGPGEACDPPESCPTSCEDTLACTRDTLVGAPGTCTARCEREVIAACAGGDGCCPVGCTASTDPDCSATCGDGIVDPGETCDPPGSCPIACEDGNACTVNTLVGSAAGCSAACAVAPVTACISGDGCCAPGCAPEQDADCSLADIDCRNLSAWPTLWAAFEHQLYFELSLARVFGVQCPSGPRLPASPVAFDARLMVGARCAALDAALDGSLDAPPAEHVAAAGYGGAVVRVDAATAVPSASAVVQAWLASPELCDAITDPALNDVGFGIARNPDLAPGSVVVQAFGDNPLF